MLCCSLVLCLIFSSVATSRNIERSDLQEPRPPPIDHSFAKASLPVSLTNIRVPSYLFPTTHKLTRPGGARVRSALESNRTYLLKVIVVHHCLLISFFFLHFFLLGHRSLRLQKEKKLSRPRSTSRRKIDKTGYFGYKQAETEHRAQRWYSLTQNNQQRGIKKTQQHRDDREV